MFGAFFYAGYRLLVSHTILYGDFTVLALGILDLSFAIIALIHLIAKKVEYSTFFNNYEHFMQYESAVSGDQPGEIPPRRAVLDVDGITFSYPGQLEPVLKNLSFCLHPDEIIAVVGRNGAGKSTLIKLLQRFYDPQQGRICYGGTDIRKYSVAEYRSLFGTIFQEANVFAISMQDNILMRRALPEDSSSLDRVVRQSGLAEVVNKLPKQLETVIGREYDEEGAILSGGELQKVGIARAMSADSPIIIMDEPSSALDPIAEARLFETLRAVCTGRTVLFISHRLSAARISDRILFLDNGRITEAGTHKELMEIKGKYFEMYQTQADLYKKDRMVRKGE